MKIVKFVAMAGVGFFSDGWANISIGLVVPMLGMIYWKENDGKIPPSHGDQIKGALLLGMIIGQIGFGLVADALGRHKVYAKGLMIMIFGTLMVVLLPWKGLSQEGIVAYLAVFRVIVGIGIGGDFPMSSSLSAEVSRGISRSRLVLSVFSCGAVGSFTAGIFYLILISAFKKRVEADIDQLEYVWRILLGLNLIPAVATLYARIKVKETKPYEEFVSRRTGIAKEDARGIKDQLRDFREYFANRRHATTLFALCSIWFLFDIAFYGVNLNQAVILTGIGYGKGATKWETLYKTAVGNLIMNVAGYLPGFALGTLLPDWVGRKRQQFVGSCLITVLYAIWAGVDKIASTGGLLALYAISQLTLNAGLSCPTYLYPVEVFPTRVRGSAHGLAAASGKAGAVLTSFAFGTVVEKIGLQGTFGLFSGIMAVVSALTLLLPEPKGITLAELETEALYGRPDVIEGISAQELAMSDAQEEGRLEPEEKVPRAPV